jgi:hypothetical protein
MFFLKGFLFVAKLVENMILFIYLFIFGKFLKKVHWWEFSTLIIIKWQLSYPRWIVATYEVPRSRCG